MKQKASSASCKREGRSYSKLPSAPSQLTLSSPSSWARLSATFNAFRFSVSVSHARPGFCCAPLFSAFPAQSVSHPQCDGHCFRQHISESLTTRSHQSSYTSWDMSKHGMEWGTKAFRAFRQFPKGRKRLKHSP